MSCADVGRRERLGAAQIVLVHLNDAVAEELSRDPIPGVLTAYDGWTFKPRPVTVDRLR